MTSSICSLCGSNHENLSSSQVTSDSKSFMFHLCEECVLTILSQLKIPAKTFSLNAQDLPVLNEEYSKALKKLGNKKSEKTHKSKK